MHADIYTYTRTYWPLRGGYIQNVFHDLFVDFNRFDIFQLFGGHGASTPAWPKKNPISNGPFWPTNSDKQWPGLAKKF